MLKQRILTAIAMLVVLLPALFHSDIQYLAIVGLLLIGAASWEWARLNGSGSGASIAWAVFSIFVCTLFLVLDFFPLLSAVFWSLASAAWVLLGGYLLQGGQARWLRTNLYVRLIAGPVILVTAWLALYQSKSMGTGFLLSILLLVWVADISAYFVGRKWGQRKLAPQISPGKSWEGLAGGVFGVFVLSWSWLSLDHLFPILQSGLFERLMEHGWFVFMPSVLFLTLMSAVGDLTESLIKRSAGAKDSSQLLPGHGGVLDRLDALLPALPLAVMLAQIR